MISLPSHRSFARFALFLAISILLASCAQLPDGIAAALAQEATQPPAPGALKTGPTNTPFQPVSPTPRPSLTLTPTAPPSPTVTPSPTITATFTPAPCTETRGRVEPMEVTFSEGAAPYVFRVYTPPCYAPGGETSGATRYPVLYMIHGQTYNDDQWDRLGLDEAADALITSGEAPPFLIVMPLEKNTFEDIYVSPFGTGLVDGLVPWMDANYPTCAERNCRAIGGLSRGGAWALRLGFTRWDLFGAVGLHSTPPFIGDPNQFPYWLREIPADQVPRVYMDTGKNDYWGRSTREFEALLVQYNVAHEWYLFNGAHDEEYWSAHVGDYLAWYTQPWSE